MFYCRNFLPFCWHFPKDRTIDHPARQNYRPIYITDHFPYPWIQDPFILHGITGGMQDLKRTVAKDRRRESRYTLNIFFLIGQLPAGNAADQRRLLPVCPELVHLVYDQPAALIGEKPPLIHRHKIVLRSATRDPEILCDLRRGRRTVVLDIEFTNISPCSPSSSPT